MKFPQFLALALASCCLVSCTGTKEVVTSAVTTVTSAITTVLTNDAPTNPITPGKAEEHLVKSTNAYTLYSPDGNLFITVTTNGQMGYSVSRYSDGKTIEWIKPSKLGVNVNNVSFFKDATVTSATVKEINVTYPLAGIKSSATGHCMEAVLNLSRTDSPENDYRLEIRAYNDGVAFRYVMPNAGGTGGLQELTTYTLRSDTDKCWYGVNNQDYESEIKSYAPNRKGHEIITAPLTAELRDNRGYIAIMEGALNESYPGTNLKADGKYTYSTCFYTTPTVQAGVMTTGWRLINIADDLNDLVNNTNIYTVNEAADSTLFADTSWIEAGRSTWSWCLTHSAPTYEQMQEYIIAASKLGFEYNIIDDGWPGWQQYKQKLTDLGIMGEDLNVKQLLWGAITAGTAGYNKTPDQRTVNTFFKLLKDTHMYGAKVDFWWSDANTNTTSLQEYILKLAAQNQMIIDFHGCNKNTGLNITYPNELSREGVRGLENIGTADTTNYTTYAQWINAQLYTRFLCGHGDWTPATYNAMEIASLILIDSPLMVIAADPNAILESPAAEFIKSIPTVWDQTIVLPESEIGNYSVFAKENKGTWFVGGVASKTVNAKVKLADFLPAGTYTAEVWMDGKSGMESKTLTVTEKDTIDIGSISAGKGYAIRISKLGLSQYGGLVGTIAVNAPDGATVKYTTDGSDPMTSTTAQTANGSITLTESCRLQVAITDGDGKGTLLSYQFNKIDPTYTFKADTVYGEGKTTLNLSIAEGGKIYYTTDGSTPTTSSPMASGPIEFTESCTLKYLVVSDTSTKEGSINISVLKKLDVPQSDLPLTDAKPTSSSIGWGSAHYDTSMSPDNGMGKRPISLGGSTIDNGTKFDRGISANSTSTFKYAVPEGYSRFVGVVGIDDCVFNNTGDRAKASATLKIAFDGQVAYETEVFRMGEYAYFDVEVPAGATSMTLTFTDGGDGATCDNVSLAAPGWVK